MDKILVIGASGHARVIIEAIELNKNYQVYGLIDSFKESGVKVAGYDILGKENCIADLVNKGINKGVIAIGDNWDRYLMHTRIKKIAPDFEFITVIHPSAVISPDTMIGDGTVILASATINVQAKIGNFCILNTNSSFGHDSRIKDYSSIAPGVSIGGNVAIDTCTAISLGASVLQNVSIGKHSIIGAGSLILNDVEDYNLVYGVPGTVIRKIKKGESYL